CLEIDNQSLRHDNKVLRDRVMDLNVQWMPVNNTAGETTSASSASRKVLNQRKVQTT
ncbi:hypothetical protein DPMN_015720, partial [Dreissena polymorpha]